MDYPGVWCQWSMTEASKTTQEKSHLPVMVPCNYQLNTLLNLRWRESQWLSSSSWLVWRSEGSCLNWVNWGEKTQSTMGSTIPYVGDPVLRGKTVSRVHARMPSSSLCSWLWLWLATSEPFLSHLSCSVRVFIAAAANNTKTSPLYAFPPSSLLLFHLDLQPMNRATHTQDESSPPGSLFHAKLCKVC